MESECGGGRIIGYVTKGWTNYVGTSVDHALLETKGRDGYMAVMKHGILDTALIFLNLIAPNALSSPAPTLSPSW